MGVRSVLGTDQWSLPFAQPGYTYSAKKGLRPSFELENLVRGLETLIFELETPIWAGFELRTRGFCSVSL